MPVDLLEFAKKLRRYREQLEVSFAEVAAATGITAERLTALEGAQIMPTGDEVLILADFFRCDYRFFISNEKLAAFEQTETLYRRFGPEFSKPDRRRVQEFLFLCECEQFLFTEMHRGTDAFRFSPSGKFYKKHAEDAALALRKHFSYPPHAVPGDVYAEFRRIGFHVFRRHLDNSNISGLTIQHPSAGACMLVNYSEDVYRQRFTAAHEAAHGIFDSGEEVVVSFTRWKNDDLVEIRANTFASRFLLPPNLVASIPVRKWTPAEIVQWASRLMVSTAALAIALKEAGIVDEATVSDLRKVSVPAAAKVDPELANLTGRSAERKADLLQRGLTTSYVALCFEAYSSGIITAGRAAEMMLVDDFELAEIADLFRVKLMVE